MPGIDSIIGKKLGMTQVFDAEGKCHAVTAIEAGPCKVTQIKSPERDSYSAVQIGFEQAKKLNAAEKGHLKDLDLLKNLREIRVNSIEDIKKGDIVNVSIFKPGDKVDVIGTSKGKGVAGVVKRYHFRGGPKTHGQSDRNRAPGSIGSTTTPGHIWKGLKMAGHLGNSRVTAQNLAVFKTDTDKNILLIKGAIPGATNSLVIVRKSRKGS